MTQLRRGSRHNLTRDEWRVAPHAYAPRGEAHANAKLTAEQVAALRAAVEERERLRREITERLSNEALARQFGVHRRTIEKVISRESYVNVAP